MKYVENKVAFVEFIQWEVPESSFSSQIFGLIEFFCLRDFWKSDFDLIGLVLIKLNLILWKIIRFVIGIALKEHLNPFIFQVKSDSTWFLNTFHLS